MTKALFLVSALMVAFAASAFADAPLSGTQLVYPNGLPQPQQVSLAYPTETPPPQQAPNVYSGGSQHLSSSWKGAYVGLTVGGDFGTSNHLFTNGTDVGDFAVGGVGGGLELGYNYQSGRYVYGIEADLSGSSTSGHKGCVDATSQCETDQEWFATLRPRLGYTFGSFLPYITGGVAVGEIRGIKYDGTTGVVSGDNSATQVGFVAGAGAEYMFAQNWSVKAEYLYAQYADASLPAGTGNNYKDSLNASILRVGVNYRFY